MAAHAVQRAVELDLKNPASTFSIMRHEASSRIQRAISLQSEIRCSLAFVLCILKGFDFQGTASRYPSRYI